MTALRRPRPRPLLAAATGLLAAAAGLAALRGLWSPPSLEVAAGAAGLHCLAALLARLAARHAGALPAERDLVVLLAVVAPLFGPALAWLLPVGRRPERVRNAHAAHDTDQLRSERARRPRLRRELQVSSHAEVLQQGTLEEKRNLLRQLARVGERRYLTLLRQFLHDPEPELRLCAYAELATLCEAREAAIEQLRFRTESSSTSSRGELAQARAVLAEANRAYASSGLLDEGMAHYWLDQARQLATSALVLDPDCRPAQRVLALVLAENGDVERAWSLLADLPAEVDPDSDLARAELAFRRRDRATCLAVAARLQAAGCALPAWLDTVAHGPRVAEAAR